MAHSCAHCPRWARSRVVARLCAAGALSLLASAFAAAAQAQARPSVEARIGLIRHELVGHSAVHPTLGVEALPLRVGAARVGVGVDGWLDRIDLGTALGHRRIDARYVQYGVRMETSGERLFVSAGAGGETAFFGERYEAAALLPRSSTSPQGSVGIGVRVPLPGSASPWSVRLEGRGHAVYAEVFDPTGVREGRELGWMPAISLGISRATR